MDEKTIGGRLRELRNRRGLTQGQLAEKLGLDQTLISNYERGAVRMHGALVAAFATALQASADELLGLQNVKAVQLIKNRRLLERVSLVEKLPAPDQRALVRFLDALLARHGLTPRSERQPRGSRLRAAKRSDVA